MLRSGYARVSHNRRLSSVPMLDVSGELAQDVAQPLAPGAGDHQAAQMGRDPPLLVLDGLVERHARRELAAELLHRPAEPAPRQLLGQGRQAGGHRQPRGGQPGEVRPEELARLLAVQPRSPTP